MGLNPEPLIIPLIVFFITATFMNLDIGPHAPCCDSAGLTVLIIAAARVDDD
jgi:hypothetical protein